MSRLGRVAVAIPSWNGRRHLETCLAALAEQHDPGVPWRVWVLDNGSRDGTADWLRREHPEVELVASPVNLGFAGGVNRLVAESGADAVALLNNDTRPRREWLGELVGGLAAAPPDVAAVSGLIVDWEGERLDFGRGIVTFDGHAFQLDYRRPLTAARLPEAGEELPFACGGNLLVRTAAFRAAGGLDDDFFAYYEDVDLGWRLWATGHRILAAPGAVAHHRSMASSDLLGAYHRGMLFERNAFLAAYKNFDDATWSRLGSSILLTLLARTETLLAEHNPGGAQLRIDPYAGAIADTAPRRGERAGGGAAVDGPPDEDGPGTPRDERRSPPPEGRHPLAALWSRLSELGPREAARRAVQRLGRRLAGPSLAPDHHPVLADARTVSQLRAVSWLMLHLDEVGAKRERVQAARVRPDAEILARFPLWVVPTYPGDERLFASSAFRQGLPADLPLVEATLPEVMAWGE